MYCGIFNKRSFGEYIKVKNRKWDSVMEKRDAEPYPLNQEDTERLVSALREIVFYQRDNFYMDYDGCSFTTLIIEKSDGEGHRTKYKPCDDLGWLLHSFMDKAFEEGFYTK